MYLAVTRERIRPPITGLHLQFVNHGDTLIDTELWEAVRYNLTFLAVLMCVVQAKLMPESLCEERLEDADLLHGEAEVKRLLCIERNPNRVKIASIKLRYKSIGLGRNTPTIIEDANSQQHTVQSQPPKPPYRTLQITTVTLLAFCTHINNLVLSGDWIEGYHLQWTDKAA